MAPLQLVFRSISRLVPWALVGAVLMACGQDGNASPRGNAPSGAETAKPDDPRSDASGGTQLGQMLDDIDQVQSQAGQRVGGEDAATAAAKGGTGEAGKPSKVTYIPGAEQVDIAQYAVAGETTIFDFYSEFCGPCRQIGPFLERLDKARNDISVVKVDINRPGVRGIDWGSPVARQYKLDSVPHFKIYGPDGQFLSEGKPAYQQIVNWIQQLEG